MFFYELRLQLIKKLNLNENIQGITLMLVQIYMDIMG